VGVELLPHVHLDGERLAAGDQPPARHQDGSDDAHDDDGDHEERERPRVARPERGVDHVLRQPDERDRRRLRTDGEGNRDGERDLVRRQEAEQACERASIERSGRLFHP
jgi:hypothetical protein